MNESKRYPGLVVGSPEYHRAAQRKSRERLIARIGIDERRRRERERVARMRANDRRPLDAETLARMEAAVRARARA